MHIFQCKRTLMIDPFDDVEKEKMTDAIRIKVLYEIILYILKIILILILFLMVLSLILIVVIPEEGIVLQPFESSEKNVSCSFIANSLCFEMQSIKKINEINIEKSEMQSRIGGNMPSIKLPASSLDYRITGLGNVGAGGTSLSLGYLILTLKQFIGRRSPELTGSIQGGRSHLCIIAILNDPSIPGGIMAWKIKNNNGVLNEEIIPIMIEDLAFQIANSLNNENEKRRSGEFPKTWEALKNLTMSRKAYIRYNATGNINSLNESRDFALDVWKSEPSYSKLSILLSILASSYLELNNNKEAEQLFRNATELDSSYANAWDGLGLALLRQDNYLESIHALDQINPEDRTTNSWYNRGLALYYLGKFEESIKAYDQAIKLDPANADAWFNKGISILDEHRSINESILAFDEVIKINPKDEDAWYNKGCALYEMENYSESAQVYEGAIKLNSSYKKAWYMKGLSLAMDERYNESIQSLDNAIELDQNYTNAWKTKGGVLFELGDWNGSICAYDKAIELDPQDEDAIAYRDQAIEELECLRSP